MGIISGLVNEEGGFRNEKGVRRKEYNIGRHFRKETKLQHRKTKQSDREERAKKVSLVILVKF